MCLQVNQSAFIHHLNNIISMLVTSYITLFFTSIFCLFLRERERVTGNYKTILQHAVLKSTPFLSLFLYLSFYFPVTVFAFGENFGLLLVARMIQGIGSSCSSVAG